MQEEVVIIYTDGGARGNPGPAGAGAVIYNENKNIVAEISEYLGECTNNWAEYEALILALEKTHNYFNDVPPQKVIVHMDSELIVRQMTGEYKVKNPDLKKQFERAQEALTPFPDVDFVHVPREENTDADQLANDAMDRGH